MRATGLAHYLLHNSGKVTLEKPAPSDSSCSVCPPLSFSFCLSVPVYFALTRCLSHVSLQLFLHLLSSLRFSLFLSPGVSSFSSIPPFNYSWGVRTVWLSLLTNHISLFTGVLQLRNCIVMLCINLVRMSRSNRYGGGSGGLCSSLMLIVREGGVVRRTLDCDSQH